MNWNPDAAIADFTIVAQLAGVELSNNTIQIESLLAPHVAPPRLPAGRMAVYVFSRDSDVLKIGKVGPNSSGRYTSQHYNPDSAASTLAASIIADRVTIGLDDVAVASIGRWIKRNIDRTNFLMDAGIGMPVLTLLETFLQCRLKPRYEGFKSQRL